MIKLTNNPGSLQLLSFLLAFGLVLTIVIGCITWIIMGGFSLLIFTGAFLALLLIAFELLFRSAMLPIFKLWNTFIKQYSKFMRWWITSVCFYIVLTAVGIPGKNRQFRKFNQDKSMWCSRFTLDEKSYRSQYSGKITRGQNTECWSVSYIKWAMTTHNKWMVFLLPFIYILKIHKVDEEKDFPTNIYTLY